MNRSSVRTLGLSTLAALSALLALPMLGRVPALGSDAGQAAAQQVATMVPAPARDQSFELSIRSIMRGPELIGQSPAGVRWTDDSEWIYFSWLPGGNDWYADRELYRVPAGGGEPEQLSDSAADAVAPLISGGDLTDDRRWRVTSVNGDLYLVDRRSMEVTQLTETTAREGSPMFSADESSVYFTQDQNLFALNIDDGGIRQLTDIRSGPAPREAGEAEGQKGFLETQQEELFEHIRIQKQREAERDSARERREAGEPETVYLGERERVRSLDPNPQGTYVVVSTYIPAQGDQSTIVPEWITASGYTEDINGRSKVGDAQSQSRVGLLEVATGEITWLDLKPKMAEDSAATGEGEGGEMGGGRGGAPDLISQGFAGWNDAGTTGLLQSIAYDYKTGWLWSLDAATGELTTLETMRDSAWLGGACFGCAGWIPNSDRAWYVSEASGWAHLYAVDADGSDRRQLTSGEWEVRGVSIPEDRSHFDLETSRTSPFDTHFYTMDFDGSDLTQVTVGDGEFQATPSPDGRRLAVVASRGNRPPELFVGRNRPGAGFDRLEQVTVSPTAEWLTFPWVNPEIVRFEAEDGVRVPARIYRPGDMGAESNGAAVVFVHGAGYLQNVSHGWSGYFREYMFHHYLAAMGYTVLDIDYRGSAGYGRDWRTAIYRWMGGADLSDQVDGAAYLVAHEGIDADRIGIYGGSYGGFMTLMALFTAGDTFHAGAAIRSVTDWAHYNHWYTSRILNQPQDDPEAYEKSSPIYFADGLGPNQHLLILHGMVDTNVHFSDVVRLSQRLIELGKENWSMAAYPVENHGFVEPASWTDEYRRIFELMDRVIGAGVAVDWPAGMAGASGSGR